MVVVLDHTSLAISEAAVGIRVIRTPFPVFASAAERAAMSGRGNSQHWVVHHRLDRARACMTAPIAADPSEQEPARVKPLKFLERASREAWSRWVGSNQKGKGNASGAT